MTLALTGQPVARGIAIGHSHVAEHNELDIVEYRIGPDEVDVEVRRFRSAIDAARESGATVHLMGLLSPGGVHSHEDQFLETLELAAERGAQSIAVHGFLDGRDTPPRSALHYLPAVHEQLRAVGGGIASLRTDPQGKGYAQLLLAEPVPVPRELAQQFDLETL